MGADPSEVLRQTLDRAAADNYSGYSKFDGLSSPVAQALSFGWWPLRLIWSQVVMRAPVNLRPLLATPRGVNPETPALFARANLDLFQITADEHLTKRAHDCLQRLLKLDANSNGGYAGSCWGYNHPWQNTGFYQPPGFPNCYLTTIVGEALLHGHRVLGGDTYLQTARSAVDFILNDLPVIDEDNQQKCISYVPKMRSRLVVININALASAFIAGVGAATGEQTLLDEARRLMTFVSRQQTADGAWFYTTDPSQSLVSHDNYHTGMILDALQSYAATSGDRDFESNRKAGLTFYREQLFLSNGAPKWTSDKTYPHDIHGSAQGTLSFALAGDLHSAERIAAWGITHFYRGDGNFSYQRGRWWHKRFTLAHWCNGWMARGLGMLLIARADSTNHN